MIKKRSFILEQAHQESGIIKKLRCIVGVKRKVVDTLAYKRSFKNDLMSWSLGNTWAII